MRMYFNEDTKSDSEELNGIINDFKNQGKEVEERYRKHKATAQKTKEAMQEENKKFDKLKELLNQHKGDFAKIDEAIKLSKTDPKKAKEILSSLGIPEEEIAAHIKEVKNKTFLERLKDKLEAKIKKCDQSLSELKFDKGIATNVLNVIKWVFIKIKQILMKIVKAIVSALASIHNKFR